MKNHYARSRGTLNRALVVLTLTFLCASNTFAFSGGDGSPENPYQVATATHLNDVRNHMDAHFVQTADIDFEEEPFEPIGHASGLGYTSFTGTYDGGYFAILNFDMSYPEDRHIGLFAYLDSGEIRNVDLRSANIIGLDCVGGIAGSAPFGAIKNCLSRENHIESSQSVVGGIVGNAGSGYDGNIGLLIEYCISHNNSITGTHYAGGIAGSGSGTKIENCYSTSSVTANEIYTHPNMGTRSFCGGIAGHSAWGGQIINSYSVGPLAAADGNPAGISGFYSYSGASVNGCYWNTETTGTEYTYGSGTGKTTVQMMQQSTFSGWNFADIWQIDQDRSYPHFKDPYPTQDPPPSGLYTLSYTAGEGGTIGGAAEQNVLYGGNGQAVTALPTVGWEFVQWSDGITTAERQAINVTAPISVVAEFTPIQYMLSYTAGQGGTIDGLAEQNVLYGEDGQSVTAVPLADWRFVQWSDGVTTAPRQDLDVTSALSVAAEFAPIQELLDFAVIDSDASGVSITPSGNYLVRDSMGSIHVTYKMNTVIYSSRSDDNGTSWSARLRAETYPNSTSPNTLAIDGADVLHLGFTFNVGSFYTRSVDRGGSWQSPVALHDGGWGDWDFSPQIAVASNGDLSVVYYTLYGWGFDNLPFNLVFKESDNSGATWTPREDLTSYAIDSGSYGAREQNYCLGSDGWRFVGYTFNEDPARDSGIPVRRLIYYDGTDWTEVQVSTTGHAVRAGGDMAVDSQGQLHLTWVESSIAGEADQLMYRRFDPATRQMSAIRRISLGSENPKNVSLGVYADDTVAIAYDLHHMELEEVVYEGVYLRASDDDFRSPRRVSTHPNGNTPNLRSHTEFMYQSDKWDMLWIEPTADVSSGQLVYADVSPLAPVGGFIVELLAAPSEGGDVTGGGFVPSGTSVLVEAQPKEGWSFVAWMEDGVEVSTEPSYEWTPQADASLTANFLDRSGESYTLHYVEGTGGSITGHALQTVGYGGSGSEVFAEAAAGAAFHQWSDGSTDNPRMDQNVQADLTVTAQFQTAGGVDIDWYAAHEIAPAAGQTWTDLDDMDWLGKGMTLADEFVAGTDPNDLQSYFAATPPAVEGTGFSVHFQPSLPERRYTLFRSTDLSEWLPVPGMQNVPGGNGPMVDSNPPEDSAFYRIEVSLP